MEPTTPGQISRANSICFAGNPCAYDYICRLRAAQPRFAGDQYEMNPRRPARRDRRSEWFRCGLPRRERSDNRGSQKKSVIGFQPGRPRQSRRQPGAITVGGTDRPCRSCDLRRNQGPACRAEKMLQNQRRVERDPGPSHAIDGDSGRDFGPRRERPTRTAAARASLQFFGRIRYWLAIRPSKLGVIRAMDNTSIPRSVTKRTSRAQTNRSPAFPAHSPRPSTPWTMRPQRRSCAVTSSSVQTPAAAGLHDHRPARCEAHVGVKGPELSCGFG